MDDAIPKTVFEFGSHLPVIVAVAAVCGAALAAGWWWRGALRGLPPRRRAALALLRAAALGLLLFMVLDPLIISHRSIPGEDYVVVLLDDSRSMRIAGDDGISRGERLQKAYEAARRDFDEKLRDTHHLAMYAFGGGARRLGNAKELTFDQTDTDLAGAIDNAERDLAGAKISAVVLVSDGVQQSAATSGGGGGAGSAGAALPPAGGPPIYTVGVDTESPWRDLELSNVAAVRTNFDKSPVSLTADVSAVGLKGRQAVVEALEGDKVVASKPLAIATDSMQTKVRLEFVPIPQGWDACTARVRLLAPTLAARATTGDDPALAAGERVMENNAASFVVDNRKKTYRVLYLSGRPNWQNKFVSRAMEHDPELTMSSLIRISSPNRFGKFEFRGGGKSINNALFEGFDENEMLAPRYDESSFIRLGMKEAEMETGYPEKSENLFPFDLIIWGDIEADFFSPKHMEVTRDFVSKRGGSLLLLGGPRSLSEGKFSGTLIETMLPVLLNNAPPKGEQNMEEFFKAKPSVEGFLSGVWALDKDPQRNDELWRKEPQLFGVNLFPMMRAGATKQANTIADTPDVDSQTLFAQQRYGLGRTAVLATGETWQWQMENEPEDVTHERFWRQLIRSMVSDVPAPVQLQSSREGIVVGQTTKLNFLVRDASFDKREGLNTNVQLTPPGQAVRELPAEESIAEPGVYSSDFTPETPGMHLLALTAMNDKNEIVGKIEQAVNVQPDMREYRGAQYNPGALKQIATATHGKFYTLDRLGDLAKDIPKLTAREDKPDYDHLWKFPPLFALLAAIMSVEWFFRRKYGQP